jgi:hypothetical protein
MGDRGNVFFVDGKSGKELAGIYMYSHWGGAFLPAQLRAALVRGRERWGDPQYLARIIFCELIQEDVLSETGYGLSTRIGDNEHSIIRVDDGAQRVSFHEPGKERNPKDKGSLSWSYDEYVTAGDTALLRAFAPEMIDAPSLPVAKAKVKKQAAPKPKKAAAKKSSPKKPAKKSATKKSAR